MANRLRREKKINVKRRKYRERKTENSSTDTLSILVWKNENRTTVARTLYTKDKWRQHHI